jgi:lysyl-tRNA synthetase class 2
MKTWQKLRQHPELLHTYLGREQVIDAIRLFFKQQGFHEVDTPLLAEHPGTEPYLEVFETQLKFSDGEQKRAFLLTSPEYALKKLLVAGLGNIFQICKCLRNGEGKSGKHNPEFTIMEWYRAEADYTDVMKDCENMFLFILEQVKKRKDGILEYQGKKYDISTPWERVSMAEAFQKYAGIDTDTLLSEEKLTAAARKKGYTIDAETTWESLYNQIFLNEIEPHLGQTKPTIVYDYPASQAALSRKKENDPRFAERFEFYVGGVELGNAFSELTDPDEQEKRLLEEEKLRKELGKIVYEHDPDFIDALRVGMPRSSGIAVGIDRIVMLFVDAPSIKETLFFPVEDMFELE